MTDNNLSLQTLWDTLRRWDESKMPTWKLIMISLCNMKDVIKTLRSLGYTVKRSSKSRVWRVTFQSATKNPSYIWIDKTGEVKPNEILVVDIESYQKSIDKLIRVEPVEFAPPVFDYATMQFKYFMDNHSATYVSGI